MAQTQDSSLTWQLYVNRLINFDLNLAGSVFIRYYIFTRGGTRICINTREVPSTSQPCWDELASLDCHYNSDLTRELVQPRRIVFELRLRRVTWLGSRSKLLGRAEVASKDVVLSPGMSVEKQIRIVMKSQWVADGKPTLVVRTSVGITGEKKREEETKRSKECECRDCKWSGNEEDMFLAANIW